MSVNENDVRLKWLTRLLGTDTAKTAALQKQSSLRKIKVRFFALSHTPSFPKSEGTSLVR